MRSVIVRVAESGWQTTTLLVETHARKHTRTHRGKLAEKVRLGCRGIFTYTVTLASRSHRYSGVAAYYDTVFYSREYIEILLD